MQVIHYVRASYVAPPLTRIVGFTCQKKKKKKNGENRTNALLLFVRVSNDRFHSVRLRVHIEKNDINTTKRLCDQCIWMEG